MHGADKRANHSGSSRRGWQLCSAAHHKVAEHLRVPFLLTSFLTPAAFFSSTLHSLAPLQPFPVNSQERPALSRCVSACLKMLACTEMITMCLQSAKQKHLRAQQQQQQQPLHSAGQGLTIFHDVSASTPLLIHFCEKQCLLSRFFTHIGYSQY